METVRVGQVRIGGGSPVWIAGPCVLEEPDRMLSLAASLDEVAQRRGVPWIFKASFDKANRTSVDSRRGPGLDEGLMLLRQIRETLGVAVTTDIHLPEQAAVVAEHVDLIQIPAFLCRQTDLLVAAGNTGRPVNIKKGPFMAPEAMAKAVEKCRSSGSGGVCVTERGTTFGHGDLVVDLRSITVLQDLGIPVVYDATHSVQRPGGLGDRSGGDRRFVCSLARAAMAAGADALFSEVHPHPEQAWSDAATQWPLARVDALLDTLSHWRDQSVENP